MTSSDTLGIAVLRLREAGYVDASPGAARVGDPTHVLSVSVDDAPTRERVWRIVREADPGARAL
jgi:hypothetical protein